MMKKIEIWRREKRDGGGWKKPLADEKLTPLLLLRKHSKNKVKRKFLTIVNDISRENARI